MSEWVGGRVSEWVSECVRTSARCLAAAKVEEAERLQRVATTILGMGVEVEGVVTCWLDCRQAWCHPFDDGFEDEFECDQGRLHASLKMCTRSWIRITLTLASSRILPSHTHTLTHSHTHLHRRACQGRQYRQGFLRPVRLRNRSETT